MLYLDPLLTNMLNKRSMNSFKVHRSGTEKYESDENEHDNLNLHDYSPVIQINNMKKTNFMNGLDLRATRQHSDNGHDKLEGMEDSETEEHTTPMSNRKKFQNQNLQSYHKITKNEKSDNMNSNVSQEQPRAKEPKLKLRELSSFSNINKKEDMKL